MRIFCRIMNIYVTICDEGAPYGEIYPDVSDKFIFPLDNPARI